MKKPFKKNYSLTYPKIVALGFFLIIAIGTILLSLPIATKSGDSVKFVDALLTATSATCVTGLVAFDTFTKWSIFGQLVILCLIQIGGLGFITILSTVTKIIKKRVTLKERMLLKESVGSIYISGVTNLGKLVLFGTMLFETIGAILLATQFIPLMGIRRGIYVSIFMSISAFCNAGFDLLGGIMPSSSLVTVNSNPVILITLALLIIIGGIGFIVWDDIKTHKFKIKEYNLHSKIVLATTTILIVLGTALYLVFERNNTFQDMNFWQSLLNAFFTDVTTRTAGFNSVDTSSLSDPAKMITMIFMFIGGSPGSTAGGIKTTTIAIAFLCVISTVKNKDSISIYGKRVDFSAVKKAVAIIFINITEIFIAFMLISVIQPEFNAIDILFECVSALGTVGMTCGITPLLETAPKIIITLLMFIGRLTSLVFALMFIVNKAKTTTEKPRGIVVIG